MLQPKQIHGLFLNWLGVNSGAVLTGAGGQQNYFAFQALVNLNINGIDLTLLGGSWVANDAAYWNMQFIKNGAGTGNKTLQTVGAGGTGNIAQNATVQLIAPAFFTCVAGDVYILEIIPIGGPANLPVAEVTFNLTPT